MRETFVTLLVLAAGLALMFTCVDYANSKETTTLDDALNRPVKIEKYVDKANNVVCYWQEGSQYLTCLQRRGLRQHNSDVR
jgi:hypothetical protein